MFWSVKTPTMTVPDEKTGEDVTLTGETKFRARTFVVFNAGHVNGYTPKDQSSNAPDPIETAEAFFAGVGADVEHRAGGRAYYSPAQDLIVLPPFSAFSDAGDCYATRAHESAHWTAPSHRLGRDLSGRFGDESYAAEELIAELSAAFTCAVIGISPTPRPDHAAYLASWLRILKADPAALFTMASKAQAATDYLTRTAGFDTSSRSEELSDAAA